MKQITRCINDVNRLINSYRFYKNNLFRGYESVGIQSRPPDPFLNQHVVGCDLGTN
jgi:hypothetical protein